MEIKKKLKVTLMSILYFAYGSNMSFNRISERINIVETVNIGFLLDYKLLWNKKSVDGTGKANIVYSRNNVVWGVVYKLYEYYMDKLDQIEEGYERKSFEVITEEGKIEANAYISYKLTDAYPTKYYKEFVFKGAVEHKLPDEYINYLTSIPTSN
jgi:gamma-glutamylcyclotransferase